MALTRVTSGGIAPGIVIKFDSDNTPTNPAISFEGDTNTGMYQPADDEIAFSTAGVERFRIKADGNIVAGNGTIIGGTNPDFDNAVNVVLYVNQSDKNATDSIDNDGGNLIKPFKTIERALLEAANKSEVAGAQDRFEAFTIMVLPGDYEIDNRPGYDVINNPVTGLTDAQFQNNLYRFNPRNGGVIVPRGTSIVGYDLRKTVIRPKYVPTPTSDEGSIDEGIDYYQIGSVFYDGARMIEKARGYIVEQAYLKIEDDYSLSNINAKCKRDIGYFVDGIIADLRGGGNSNSFVVGEWYTLGQDDDGVNETSDITGTDSDGQGAYLKSAQEVTATKAAFDRCRDIINAFLDYAKRDYFDSGESEYSATNIVGYYTETTSGKTVARPTFATNVDYAEGYSNGTGDCSDVQDAVTALTAVVTGILDAPDTFNDTIKKTLPVTFQTSIFKVTGGCYFWQMTFKDAKTNPYNKTTFSGSGVPTFTQASSPAYSHHRVVAFSYADQRSVDGELERYYRRIDAWVGSGTREARIEEYRIVGNSELKTQIDTVNGCSPYIFNCSLRSVLGLCGMHTDGSKVKENSFKSMVVAQYTGISLQRDPNAYWQPNNKTGKVYTDTSTFSTGDTFRNIASDADSGSNRGAIFADPDAEYKHDWRHFHIKASNGAFIQVVSVFAVGYADQFLSVNGGDMSITNSNSNFGQISLRAAGNKFKADPPSAYGKITAIIPPAGISKETRYTEIYPISAKDTWESNLGTSATKAEPDWINSKSKFGSAGNDYFKLYLEIPGIQDEDEIPEMVVESVDNNSGSTIVRRFLTFGSNNNFNLFRDYFETSGRLDPNDCQIVNQVDSNSGGLSTYNAVVFTDTPADDTFTNNHERVGYYWDRTRKKIYLKLNPNKLSTRNYINDFVFSTIVETSFITVTETNDDGSTTVVSKTEDVNVLEYWDSFPGSTTSPKLIDSRASIPNDLLWRVKYVIPKNYTDGTNILTPKAPEKRFIIKGTNPDNDPYGVPYTNYRFTIWDVQEIQTWDRGNRDGEYYLTVLRSDIDKFVDGEDGSGFENNPYVINRSDSYDTIIADQLSELALNDRNYKVTSNVNYLYPSTNEEGNITDPRVLWNPPQTDSRVIVERLGSVGLRAKDVSVPNKKYYNSTVSSTPYYEVPALTSVTAEACHRLVHALDLCYIKSNQTTTTNIKVAPVSSWDDRSGKSTYNDIGTNFNIYGSASNAFRYGDTNLTINNTDGASNANNNNKYGISGNEEFRKIPVCGRGISASFGANENNDSDAVFAAAPVVPLLRPSILRASSHTWEYIGIGPGNYSTGFPNLQTRVLKAYEQFIAQGYENAGGFVASSGTNSQGDFYIGNQIIQAGGQSTTTLNVPKVRKSSESNVVDVSDIENRISNNVINVIPSANKSSAQQDLLKGLSNFFTTARLTVTDRANIQTLFVTDRMFIANSAILNGEKFPEGGPEGYGFAKGARPEKTGFIATDTNDRLYVSPKYLDAWRIKKKILSASNINLDNNRIYVEPLSRTFIDALPNDASDSIALSTPIAFTGNINNAGEITITTGGIASKLYVGMKIAQVGGSNIIGEATVESISGVTVTLSGDNATFTGANTLSFYAVDRVQLVDSSGMPPFGRVDIEMQLANLTDQDYIEESNTKFYLNPNINISLQYDEVDYTNNTLTLSSIQNFAPYKNYVESVLPVENNKLLQTILKNYSSVLRVINDDVELSDTKYLKGSLTSNVSADIVTEEGTHAINTSATQINVDSTFFSKLPTRGSLTLRFNQSGTLRYSTFVYFKDIVNSKVCLLRKVDTQSSNDNAYTHIATGSAKSDIYFSGCETYISYGDKWTVEKAFIPDVEEISEDVDIESATLYELPVKPAPFTGIVTTEDYTDSIVPNPVTSKALGANLQTKRTVKTFQPFENLKQVADFAVESGFTASDEVEVIMKPGYYRLAPDSDSYYESNIKFPCKVKINGSGTKKTGELYSKELANESAGRIGGYSLNTVKSGDSVSFFRSPQFRNNWGGRSDNLYVSSINDRIESTGGINIQNVHFLGLNEAITRNEILDNSYSEDEYTIRSRRKVRKAWYVKQSKGFPTSESGVVGGLRFHANNPDGTATTLGGKFTYVQKTDEFTDATSGLPVAQTPIVNSTSKMSKNARYIKFTFDRSQFSSNEQRFDWLINYVIPGTTMHYLHNVSNSNIDSSTNNVESSTKKSRVLDVKKTTSTDVNGVTTVQTFDIFLALFDPTSDNSTADEDMDLVNSTSPWAADSLSNGIKCVFENRDGDEFVVLTYNWCKEKRNQLLPKDFTTSGEGFDPTNYDEPQIFGIIAGYRTDTLNLVIDTHPSAEVGAVKTFSRVGVAPTGVSDTYSNIAASGGSGSGALFEVTLTNGTYSVKVTDGGQDYAIGDTLTITATDMNSSFTSANNITITIGNVVPTRLQYPAYNLFNYYPSAMIKLGDNDENYGFTLPVFPNGYRRLYGRQNTRYYLLEISAKDIGGISDNTGHNSSVISRFTGFGYSDIDFDETTPNISVNVDGNAVVFTPQDRKRTSFTSDQQFEAIAKYNLWQSGFGYKKSNPSPNNAATAAETVGRNLFMNYSKNYKVNRKKFPTSNAPTVGNLGATLIKVSGIPGSDNLVTLKNVTIGAMSDANDISNTYGGAYHGGIISIENGQVDLRGVRFRGNLSLDWSGLLTNNSSRLTASNKFTYGHSVDLLETSGIIKVNRFGDNKYSAVNVSKDDINFKHYTMFRDDNNLYIEPSKLPTGVPVDYDQRTFPITTVSAITKFASDNTFNETVNLDEKYLTSEIYHDGGTPSGTYAGQTLRLNNSNQVTINDGVAGGHSDSSRDLLPKHITFTLPYSTTAQQNAAEEVAKNIVPNFTEIIREGNPDSILATVIGFEYYKKSNVAYFVIKYSGNIEYQNQQNTIDSDGGSIGGSIDMSGFKLQLLTKYIPSQRFNYISTLTTRYIKRSNADGTQHSKYEIGFDDAQNTSVFANSKDFTIEKVNGENNISRESSGSANILHFKKGTDANSINDVQAILETDATGNVISCDVVSLGLNNAQDDVLYYPSSSDQKYKITMATTVSTRVDTTETDYEMFVPGEVVNTVENSSFIVNNFIETSLTGIKSALQKVKSIISPGSYIEYGGQYYKVAYSTPGRPYLGIYRYANPSNDEDIRTSLVVRLEEKTYNINYTRSRNGETITRFDLYEDDNILRYWPNSGKLEIGELETCDFTKEYINTNVGYRISLTRSNTKFWPSYIHDWDGLQIAEALSPSDDADNPAEAPPNISTGTITGTSIRLADPVDITCSTYKRVKYYGDESVSSSYMSKTGILTNNRAYVDIASATNQLDADLNKFEVGQIVSMPWRNLGIGGNARGDNNKYNYTPSNIIVTIDDERGVAGTSGSTNREGDSKLSIVITNTKEATQDIVDKLETTDGVARLSNNLRGGRGRLYQIVNNASRYNSTASGDVYDKIDPLTTCRTTKSISSVLGKPHDDNNSVSIGDIDATNRRFTVTQNGSDDNIGKGLVPGIVIIKDGVLEKDTKISSVSRDTSGGVNNYKYTIKFNKDIISGQTLSGAVTFTNAIYTDLELFNPVMGTFTKGDTFQVVPQFNAEGHPWRRHTEVFTSRISDIEKRTATQTIRLHLSDPFTFGDTGGNTYRDDSRFINETDSRHFGFISINHGGWSFPRSGGSYMPSNMVKTTNFQDKIKLLNHSNRIKSGDTIKYTYEANAVVQEINRDSYRDSNRGRFLLRGIAVGEGDSLVGLDSSSINKYGVKDIYRENGTYIVTHRRYIDKSGVESDNYRFGNSSTNSFWNGTSFSTDAPITSYKKDGTDYFVDIGGGVATDTTQDYTDRGGDGTNVAVTQSDLDNATEDLGVYTGTGADQNKTDPFTRSLVLTNGDGKDAVLTLTVSGNEVTTCNITTKGTGYKVNDWIIVRGAVFNVNNPRYPKDLYLYISDVSSGGAIESFDPRFLLVNEEDSDVKIQIGYDSAATPPVWKVFGVPDDSAAEVMTSTLLTDQQAMFIETVSGSYVYLKAQLSNADGELITYRVERVGGFTRGMKLIFAKPKPSAKLVSGTITSVSAIDADGYSECGIDSPDNILYNTFAQKPDWLSVGDVLISHSSDLFANDGSVALRFMHSEYGGEVEFEPFRVWNDYYRNGSQNKGFGLYGSHGWVGNFGKTVDGVKPLGFTSTGSLSINWGRQRQNSIWKVAQPVRPNWTHGGVTNDVVHNGAAFTPAFKYFYTNGTNSFYSSSLLNYLMEDKQVFDNVAYTNPIKHISNTTDAINATVATTQKYLRDDWWSGRYYDGGMGPLSYQPYQWSSTFDSISTSRLVGKNHISYQLQDLRFRANNSYGDINWGSGLNARLSEQIVMDYVQHYSFGPSEGNAADYFINTGVTVELNPDGVGSYWENFRLRTEPSTNGSKNIRQGRTVTTTVVGNRYIVGAINSGSEYKVGQLFVASSTSLPTNVTSAYDYNSKIARGDAIYLSQDGGTTKTFVGFVRYVGGGSGANDNNIIYLTQAVPAAQRTGDWELYYTRPNGLKTETFENAYSQINNGDQSRGDNVLSAGLPGSSDYNLSFVIQKRNYNTSPILNTVGDVKPVGNFWWYWGAAAAHRSLRMQSGDLTSFGWSPMNINITRFNNKVHLESAVTATASNSSIGITNIFI